MDTNIFVNLFASGAAGAAATAVTLLTAEDTDKEVERIKTLEGALVGLWSPGRPSDRLLCVRARAGVGGSAEVGGGADMEVARIKAVEGAPVG